ncbi:MAG: translocation/assembly module TamB domain-containing protein, partial [Acetobacteraceae bacterium]
AELLQSDRITLWLDSNLRLTGSVAQRLAIAGTLHVRRAEIEIPKSLPPNIAVLKVVRPGAKPSPPPASAPNVALDVTIEAPREIFVRGRGVDAEFGGRIHVSGTAATPGAVGSLHLIRGALSLAGQRLTFTSGTIGFNGGDPTDPTLDLVATTRNRVTTATLTLGGTVRKPTVTLSSVPDLPQDQVLAALLFGSATSSLSPFQIVEMANALTSLTGAGPSVGNPLGTIRKALGLDQLSVGSDTSGNPTLQAGRYVARGVYVGASQSASGGGTQAQVKIDLTKRLKLEATTGSGGGSATAINTGSAPDTRNGSSIGLTYQFQY